MVTVNDPPAYNPDALIVPPTPRRPRTLRAGSPITRMSSVHASEDINLETLLNNNLPVDFNSNSSRNELVRNLNELARNLRNLSTQNSQLRYRLRIANEVSAPMFSAENILSNIQNILFENSEQIPNGIYLKLMDALIGKCS